MSTALHTELEAGVNALAEAPVRSPAAIDLLTEVRRALGEGTLRVASPTKDSAGAVIGWQVHAWVKTALLLMSRLGQPVASGSQNGAMAGVDLDTTPWRTSPPPYCRIPGGSLIREGAYLAPGVTCLPPAVVQLGAFVGAGSVLDSMSVVGAGAQLGEGVQMSSGSTIGGYLVPVQHLPTIVEDGVLMGSGSGVFDGAHVGRNAVLLAGTQIIPALGVFDLQTDRMLPLQNGTLHVPEGAIVGMGARPASRSGVSLQIAVIVGRRRGPAAEDWEMFVEMPHLRR